MRFLLPFYLILKVCQCQSLCLFQISLTSVFGREPSRHFSHVLTVQHQAKPHNRGSLVRTATLSNAFCDACCSRGLIMLGLEVQTPPCQRQTINYTQSLVGEICLKLYSFECLAILHKALTNKSNKLFIVSGLELVTSPHSQKRHLRKRIGCKRFLFETQDIIRNLWLEYV